MQPSPRRPDARSLTLCAVVALSLAGCTEEPGGWWRIVFGQVAEAAPEVGDVGNAAGNYLAGRAALEAGDLRQAADDLEHALAAAPGDTDLRRQVFELLLASGQFDRAVATARLMSERGGATDDAMLLLALDAAKLDQGPAAVALLERRGVLGSCWVRE